MFQLFGAFRQTPFQPPTLFQLCLAVVWLNAATSWAQIREFADLKTLSRLPETKREIEAAFQTSRSQGCELLPKGEPVELSSFSAIITDQDRRLARTQRLLPSTRRHVLSIGLGISERDRGTLPIASRGTILDYLDDHYVSIQVRIREDLLDDQQYFHHRPIAATASFRGSRLTQPFQPLVSASARRFHSLGLFSRKGPLDIKKPADYRTLVLLFQTEQLLPNASRATTLYEFAFVRGVEPAPGDDLSCHLFVTDANRTRLLYLNSPSLPTSHRRCSITGEIAITEYDSTGIYPKEAVARSYRLDERQSFTMEQLQQFCNSQNWDGGVASHLDQVLDAIIDGTIRADETDRVR